MNAPANTRVYLRVPGWATEARVNGAVAPSGEMWAGATSAVDYAPTVFTVAFKPAARLEHWDGGAVSVHRGALLYSLPIAANYTMYGHHFGTDAMSSDYYLTPTSEWRYALDIDPADTSPLAFASSGYKPGAAPFNHSDWPNAIAAPLRLLPTWGIDANSARDPPASPACAAAAARCGARKMHMLVPHGGTDLRIGELPVAFYPKGTTPKVAAAAAVVEERA